LRFFILDRLSHHAIHLNDWSEIPRPPLFDPLFINLRGFLAATLEYAGRALQERPLPAVDHRRMNAKLAC
jgi:hypothetical protein